MGGGRETDITFHYRLFDRNSLTWICLVKISTTRGNNMVKSIFMNIRWILHILTPITVIHQSQNFGLVKAKLASIGIKVTTNVEGWSERRQNPVKKLTQEFTQVFGER